MPRSTWTPVVDYMIAYSADEPDTCVSATASGDCSRCGPQSMTWCPIPLQHWVGLRAARAVRELVQ
jgi:hypothetical protein